MALIQKKNSAIHKVKTKHLYFILLINTCILFVNSWKEWFQLPILLVDPCLVLATTFLWYVYQLFSTCIGCFIVIVVELWQVHAQKPDWDIALQLPLKTELAAQLQVTPTKCVCVARTFSMFVIVGFETRSISGQLRWFDRVPQEEIVERQTQVRAQRTIPGTKRHV